MRGIGKLHNFGDIQKISMDALELLKGRRMKVMTDMLVEVELTIKEVKIDILPRINYVGFLMPISR